MYFNTKNDYHITYINVFEINFYINPLPALISVV